MINAQRYHEIVPICFHRISLDSSWVSQCRTSCKLLGKNWLLIVATKILEIGWMLLKTSTGGNLLWATSSTSAGSECKVNFLHIFCNLFTFHFFFTPVPNGARQFLAYRLDFGSTRLVSTEALDEEKHPKFVANVHSMLCTMCIYVQYTNVVRGAERSKQFYHTDARTALFLFAR